MSINIGDLLGALGGAGGQQQQQQGSSGGGSNLMQMVLPALLPMLASGGLTKILGALTSKGFTSQVDSWTSGQPNQPITASQLTEAVGQDTVHEVAQKAGITDGQAADAMSQLLPNLVDKVSPNGKLPATGDLNSLFSSATQMLGSK